jgi:hypothetical protein
LLWLGRSGGRASHRQDRCKCLPQPRSGNPACRSGLPTSRPMSEALAA